MRYIPQSIESSVRPLIVCCVHGDEQFGLTAFNRLKEDAVRGPRISLLLANEPAIDENKRFTESDLNRSFPGKTDGAFEERLASEMLPHLKQATHVLDIHTTTSDVVLLPIVTSLGQPVREIINLMSSKEVAFIDPPLGAKSLIGQTEGGVTLEFGDTYAEEDAYRDVLRIIDGLLDGQAADPKERQVFHVTGFIPDTIALPKDIKNFQMIPELNSFPILLYEEAYVGQHAMKATSMETTRI